MKYIKKYWFISLIIVLTIMRFLISYHLPTFYINNLGYDDGLMMKMMNELIKGNYLGNYNTLILAKGFVFPLFLVCIKILKFNYSSFLTIIYIISCAFFSLSLKKIIKSRNFLLLIYVILLFNPVSYSSDLFQRLYRNSLSIISLLFFLGLVIRIISNNKKNIIYNLLLGFVTLIMFLTREDNIWTLIVLFVVYIYKIYKKHGLKNYLIPLIPLVVLIVGLNIVSYINYKHYGIYTYNEFKNSEFKRAYIKILEIKDNKKINRVSITKDTLYKLCDVSKKLGLTKDDIDRLYSSSDENGEINNGNMIWYLRNIIFVKHQLLNGKDANNYFHELADEIDELFKNNVLEKEIIIPSVLINTIKENEIKELPYNIIKTIMYTSSYENVKTFSEDNLLKMDNIKYDMDNSSYKIEYNDYHYTENMIKENINYIEIIRIIYKYLTIICSCISGYFFFKNIKCRDKLNLIIFIDVIIYLAILLGVSYTHTTAFYAIRYFYLGNIYILQNIFIILNLVRVYGKRCNNIDAMFK